MQHETEFGNSKKVMCDCIICAAGASTRMGEWKPLLPWGKSSLVESSVRTALEAGCRVILVTGASGDRLEELFKHMPNVITVRNGTWEKGMVSSIQCGALVVRSPYFFVAHADMPLIPTHIYRDLIVAAHSRESPTANKPRVIRPCFKDAPGHPVLFDRTALPFIAALPDGESMKGYLDRCDLAFLETDNRGVVLDLDNPEIYADELAQIDLERSTSGILVVTGEKGTGKTTRIRRVFEWAVAQNLSALIIRQIETGRGSDGRAIGFDMEMKVVYADRETQCLTLPLARFRTDIFSPASRTEIGPYVFDQTVFVKALSFAEDFILKTPGVPRFFGIDEIGKLELERTSGLIRVFETIISASSKARLDGLTQYLVCSARYDTLEILTGFLKTKNLGMDIQTLQPKTGVTE